MKVIPGDTPDIEVYAKYTQPTTDNTNVVALIATAMSGAFGVNSSSTGEAGNAYTALNSIFSGGPFIGPGELEDANAPKAYLNYILFDKDFVPYDYGFDQISTKCPRNGKRYPS